MLCAKGHSKVISLYSNELTFEILDDYVETSISQKGNIGYCAKSNDKLFALLSYRNSNFDASKVLEKMDSTLCDLSKFKLVDTEKEYFWNFTTDYIIRKYETEDGQKFASYIRYVSNAAYCFGFWYNSADEFDEFEHIIDTVHFSEEKGLSQCGLLIEYAGNMSWIVIILLIIVSWVAGVGGEKTFKMALATALFFTTLAAVIFLIPFWGFWYAYAILLSIFFIACFFCGFWGLYLSIDD